MIKRARKSTSKLEKAPKKQQKISVKNDKKIKKKRLKIYDDKKWQKMQQKLLKKKKTLQENATKKCNKKDDE